HRLNVFSQADGHFSDLKFSVNHFFQTSFKQLAWLNNLANSAFVSFEALPCQ
ncbi:hypothetical protein VIS19158_22057, partial [Vibrio scophthalmi LMG 19158]